MGVKSLWSLLTPVGRPVMLETTEGKSMAIDSSIWIYQFQATMRDKEGRALVNAHVLGFLRRICKLLFYGIKPVFVFDGGAPALKRMTILERKKKKSGAAETHAQVAEKLLAAQLRKEALNQTHGSKDGPPRGPATIDNDTVYFEDLDGSNPTPSPEKRKGKEKESPKKAGWKDHDVYRLPDIDMDAAIAKATRTSAPDARLATEDELRAFIEMMRPEDLDVNSEEFRELPTQVQYEIIGDLRLKSRQTSHKRLQAMLRNSETPLDFSRAQIMNLKQRAALTQQLLETTDSIGKANVTIPIRIASERNREYVLVKNEGAEGGWVLGIRDDGTAEKPIEIDQDEPVMGDSDEDMDMEEISIPSTSAAVDPDLQKYQRTNAFTAAKTRQLQATHRGRLGLAAASPKKPVSKKSKEQPLFISEETFEDQVSSDEDMKEVDVDEGGIATAIQASLEDQEEMDLQSAIEASNREVVDATDTTTPKRPLPPELSSDGDDDDLDVDFSTSRLDTALRFANIGLKTATQVTPPSANVSHRESKKKEGYTQRIDSPLINEEEEDDEDFEEVVPYTAIREFSEPSNAAHANSRTPAPEEPSEAINGSSPELIFSKEIHPATLNAATPPALPTDFDDLEVMSDAESPWPPENSSNPSDPTQTSSGRPHEEGEGWDAAHEMNVAEEEGEFARFAAQVRGRDLDTVRQEIDHEIRELNKQRKAAMRDSEDITQAMVAQIMTMLRLFGIPYITAPMEAEAQCATLVDLGLVDGVITDDSDVFLFGAKRVFKNMFNQAKTVECFLLSDLSRELGLDRGTLIRLAYLLGSDYVLGLPGVGPVVAMELLREFPGEDGLHKFKDWWVKVQKGKDTTEDTATPFRKRFKKRFKDLYLPNDWPNAAVRDAYYHPVVDESEESFKWGLPDLDGLRSFFQEELSWPTSKVDELLLPIIHKMNKRAQDASTNRQGTLNTFFSISEGVGAGMGMGAVEPRRRDAYASKRLQALVNAHRKAQREGAGAGSNLSEGGDGNAEVGEDGAKKPARKRRKKVDADGDGTEISGPSTTDNDSTSTVTSQRGGRGRGRARGARIGTRRAKKAPTTQSRKSKSTKDSGSHPHSHSMSNSNSGSDSDDGEFMASSSGLGTGAPLREMTLRERRPKPRPAYKAAREAREREQEREQGGNSDGRDEGEANGGVEVEVRENESGSERSEYRG